MRDGLDGVLTGMTPEWLDHASDGVADDGPLADLFDGGGSDASGLLASSRLPRLRPILVVLAARASGGRDVDPELQYAAEILHAALYVHDVAVGPRGNRRRKIARKVLRSVDGLGAHRLFLRAMELVRQGGSGRALGDLVDTLREFQDGQDVLERLQHGLAPTRADWEEHADGHTGALFSFCCRAGSRTTGQDAAGRHALARFGRHLGRMWHAAEDVVLLQDEGGAAYLAGRALAGRPMLPLIVAFERMPEAVPLWQEIQASGRIEIAEDLLDVVVQSRAIAGTRETVAREHWRARQALGRLPESSSRHALERLASGLSRAPFEDRDAKLEAYER